MSKFCLLIISIVVIATTIEARAYQDPVSQPLNCTNPNEKYSCGSACQNECTTLGEPCPIVNIRCNDACYCIDGYARDSTGTCIPEKDCPPKK